MLNNISLKRKGQIILALSFIGMLILGTLSVFSSKDIMLSEKKIKLQETVNVAVGVVTHIAKLAEEGRITEENAKKLAGAVLRDIRYNAKNDYFFVFDFDGTSLVLGPKQKSEGTNLIDAKDPRGTRYVADLIKAARNGGGFISYYWERDGKQVPKMSYAGEYAPWGWMIGTGVYIDDIDAAFFVQLKTMSAIIVTILIILGVFTTFVIRSIVRPVLATSDQMDKIANEVPVEITGIERGDEFGGMAKTLGTLKESIDKQRELEREIAESEKQKVIDHKNTMNDVANRFEEKVGSVVSAVEKTASDMQKMATTLSAASEETTQQSSAVSSASSLASSNVQTVASAAEELSASISELVNNMSNTEKATKACASSAEVSQGYLTTLQSSVDDIDSVIQAISDVAEQTNLLALNATIEAARAGDAGKGFAVVASEVKALASETNSMTEKIAQRVADIKASAGDTIRSVQDIITQIDAVNERTTTVSAAIEEQNASTSEISRSAQEAAEGTGEVSNSIEQVKVAANDTAMATDELKIASDSLSEQATSLKNAVSTFIEEVRVA